MKKDHNAPKASQASQAPAAAHAGEPPAVPLDVEDLRPHTYDGILEYDKRLPNWWLFTLYGAIVFSIGYWAWYHTYQMAPEPGVALTEQMAENQRLAARASGVLDDDALWAMARDAKVVAAGKATFEATCASCHLATLTGAIGPNLIDQSWVHGGKPLEVVKVITEGVLAKGMPSWAPILGQQKITEVAAYIMSHHKPGEPITIAPWTMPGVPPVPGAAPAPTTEPAPAPATPAAPEQRADAAPAKAS